MGLSDMTELGNDGFHAPPVGLQIRLVQGVNGLLQFIGKLGLIDRPARFPRLYQLFADDVQVADVDGVEIRDELIRIHVLPQSFVVRRPPQTGSCKTRKSGNPGHSLISPIFGRGPHGIRFRGGVRSELLVY